MSDKHDQQAKNLALAMAAFCVRNSHLENLHAGTVPRSKTGDFSDVKVVTPYGEIPWNQLSRFDNEEMKVLMKDVVNRLYTVLHHIEDEPYMRAFMAFNLMMTTAWDEPEFTTEQIC